MLQFVFYNKFFQGAILDVEQTPKWEKSLQSVAENKDRVVFGRVQTEGFVHPLLCKNYWSWIFGLKVDKQLSKEEQDYIITIYKNSNTEHHDHNKKWTWTYSLPDHMSIKYDGEGIFKISQVGK
eukprot:6677264-Ditylum_brightwellii.AAC.1